MNRLSSSAVEPTTAQRPDYWPQGGAISAAVTLSALPSSLNISDRTGFPENTLHSVSTADGRGLLPYTSQGLPWASGVGEYSVGADRFVQRFMMTLPAADLGAIQQIATLVFGAFDDGDLKPSAAFDFDVDEATGPVLFMRLDTHGMDLDEQLRREVPMREQILSDERLAAAKQYMVIDVY